MHGPCRLVDADNGEIIVSQLRLATSFWQRFRGLQLRRALGADEGLLIPSCRSIHTHWMRFAIDVAMIGRDGTVLAVYPAVPPWRFVSGPKNTEAVLETLAETLSGRLSTGDRMRLTNIDGTMCRLLDS